ncbi:MAG: DUF3201 domain-containing protein [Erysipelotrichales bacterium]|nr:DUF3201 domain-containing protein [Erysipelotrichales bacterium]
MEKNIICCHKILDNIYFNAERYLKILIDLAYDATLSSYNNHYININGELVHQKYYMPVISIKDKGDICFNLDGIEFEFYKTKEELLNDINLDELLTNYENELSIYEFEDCTNDLYEPKMNIESIIQNIKNSKDSKFGISINCHHFSDEEIIRHFENICKLLNL